MTTTRWWQYIEPVISGMTMRDAAKKAGFNQSAFTRWKNGAKADPEFVVKFARAFHLNVLEALVEAEFITDKEANLKQVKVGGPSLSNATNEELVKEFLHRSGPHATRLFDSETEEEAFDATLHISRAPVSDGDGSMPLGAVAYSGPDEDVEREDADGEYD